MHRLSVTNIKAVKLMMISTRGRYALRMMVDLAEHGRESPAALKDIAARQDISKKYLEQIIPVLNRSGLLVTTRGYQGGYRLSRAPKDITVWEILNAAEGSMVPVACLETDTNTCPRCAECATLPVWEGLKNVVSEYLSGVTLQDILDEKAEKAGYNFVI